VSRSKAPNETASPVTSEGLLRSVEGGLQQARFPIDCGYGSVAACGSHDRRVRPVIRGWRYRRYKNDRRPWLLWSGLHHCADRAIYSGRAEGGGCERRTRCRDPDGTVLRSRHRFGSHRNVGVSESHASGDGFFGQEKAGERGARPDSQVHIRRGIDRPEWRPDYGRKTAASRDSGHA
jgi:hypothetical protein